MKQYDVFTLKSKLGSDRYDHMIILQSGDLTTLRTVVSAPMRKLITRPPVKRLDVPVLINGEELFIIMQELAGFPVSQLGKFKTNASEIHYDIMSAIDLLFAGF